MTTLCYTMRNNFICNSIHSLFICFYFLIFFFCFQNVLNKVYALDVYLSWEKRRSYLLKLWDKLKSRWIEVYLFDSSTFPVLLLFSKFNERKIIINMIAVCLYCGMKWKIVEIFSREKCVFFFFIFKWFRCNKKKSNHLDRANDLTKFITVVCFTIHPSPYAEYYVFF